MHDKLVQEGNYTDEKEKHPEGFSRVRLAATITHSSNSLREGWFPDERMKGSRLLSSPASRMTGVSGTIERVDTPTQSILKYTRLIRTRRKTSVSSLNL